MGGINFLRDMRNKENEALKVKVNSFDIPVRKVETPSPEVTREEKKAEVEKASEQLPEKNSSFFTDTKPAVRGVRYERSESSKEIFLGFVIDSTYSFHTVYPKVYYLLNELLKQLEIRKENYVDVTLKYGITLIGDDPTAVEFRNGSYFTESTDEVREYLENMEFKGGNAEGKELLAETIDLQMEKLCNAGEEKSYRCLMMFTDSMPWDDDLRPDFSNTIPGTYDSYENYGLRSADFYAYDKSFKPKMLIVDKNGVEASNGRNIATYHSLAEIVESNVDEIVQKAAEKVSEFMDQMSCF